MVISSWNGASKKPRSTLNFVSATNSTTLCRSFAAPGVPVPFVAGAAVLTALTVATAGASPPTPMGDAAPMGIQAPAMTRPGASPSQDPTPSREASANTPAPGFLLDNGRYTSVAIPPRLAATAPWGITPTGINDRRQIVGEYVDDRLISRGFLIDQDGRYTRIDVPGALATNAAKINNRGQIVGLAEIPDATQGPQPTDTLPMSGVA